MENTFEKTAPAPDFIIFGRGRVQCSKAITVKVYRSEISRNYYKQSVKCSFQFVKINTNNVPTVDEQFNLILKNFKPRNPEICSQKLFSFVPIYITVMVN